MNSNKNSISFSLYPHKQPSHYQPRQTHHHKKKPSWSSNNNFQSNQYQQIISPMNYKLTNPSISLAMSSVSNINQDNHADIQPTYSTLSQQILAIDMLANSNSNKENFNNMNFQYERDGIHNDFYKYLMEEGKEVQNNDKQISNKTQVGGRKSIGYNAKSNHHNIYEDKNYNIKKQTNRKGINSITQQSDVPSFTERTQPLSAPINQQNCYTIKCQPNQQVSFCSAQQSLQHLQQSQQQLTFLKFKLQEAYQKLQKQILNSYQLEQKIQGLTIQLQNKNQMIDLQKKQNDKLKFTLKAIMKNKSLLQEQIQKEQKKKIQTQKSKQQNRQNELKQNLKLKLQIKQLNVKYQNQIEQLNKQNSSMKQQLQGLSQKLSKLKLQITKKDQYLQNLTQQLHVQGQLKQQNKILLIKQAQYLNKINILQAEIRKITDEKVTTINRLKHQMALIQQQNGQLIHNQDLGSSQVFMMPMQNYSPFPRKVMSKSVSKYSMLKNPQNNNLTPKTPIIFDTQVQSIRQVGQFQHMNSQQTFNQLGLDSLNYQNVQILNNNLPRSMNNQNVSSNNLERSLIKNGEESQLQNKSKTVGKWKRAQSVSNNSSTYFQSISNQQNSRPSQQIQIETKQNRTPNQQKPGVQHKQQNCQPTASNNLQQIKQSTDSQDQKLSKYQQHRKNIQTQLSKLQKIKRPSKQQRQKMQKLEKQLYYIDSDIAGLKRKIRRKY